MPRTYRLGNRAAAVETTRRRILDATVALHAEKGALATTWQDIARRADVAVGTVFYHFPSLDELLPACTGHGLHHHPPPTPEIFDGTESLAERIAVLTRALFAFYEKAVPWLRWFRDTPDVPALMARLAERREAGRKALIGVALGSGADEQFIRVTVALTSFSAWQSWLSAGVTSELAADLVSEMLLSRLNRITVRGPGNKRQRNRVSGGG
jgi:AcrR family transcriptional regulator